MENQVLYINACVREGSRTDRLARRVLEQKVLAKAGGFTELVLAKENLLPLDGATLALREELISKGQFDHDMFRFARQFAEAEVIVIGAPFWDLSFPALLKTYLEQIYIVGLVTRFDETGRQMGLCKAKKLYYVTTAGGPYTRTYSYDYVRELVGAFGIEETELVYAENLDIVGNDPDAILDAVVLPD